MQLQLAAALHEEGGDGNGANVQHHAVRKWLFGGNFVQDVEIAAQQPHESVAEKRISTPNEHSRRNCAQMGYLLLRSVAFFPFVFFVSSRGSKAGMMLWATLNFAN